MAGVPNSRYHRFAGGYKVKPQDTVHDITRLTFSVREVAEILGLGLATAYEGIRTGAIPSIRVQKRIIVPKAALNSLLGSTGRTGEEQTDGS